MTPAKQTSASSKKVAKDGPSFKAGIRALDGINDLLKQFHGNRREELVIAKISESPIDKPPTLDDERVVRFRELYEQDVLLLPPIVVLRQPEGYLIIDGRHRLSAAQISGLICLPSVVLEGQPKFITAISLSLNLTRGPQMPAETKIQMAVRMLKAMPELLAVPVRKLTDVIGVSKSTIDRAKGVEHRREIKPGKKPEAEKNSPPSLKRENPHPLYPDSPYLELTLKTEPLFAKTFTAKERSHVEQTLHAIEGIALRLRLRPEDVYGVISPFMPNRPRRSGTSCAAAGIDGASSRNVVEQVAVSGRVKPASRERVKTSHL